MNDAELNQYLKNIGKNIKNKRLKAGLTQEDMSEHIDIDYKYYQKIESGKANITVKTLLRICEQLDEKPYDIVRTDEE